MPDLDHPHHFIMLCRVFSAYVREIEDKPESTVWGKKMSFGQVMAEFSNGRGEEEKASGSQGIPSPVVVAAVAFPSPHLLLFLLSAQEGGSTACPSLLRGTSLRGSDTTPL